MTDSDILYRIAFATYRNINYSTATRLEAKHISPEAFFTFPAATLASITGLKSTFFADDRRHDAIEAARRELDFIRANHIRAIYYTDSDYPTRLAECNDAPAMLFVLGNTFTNIATLCRWWAPDTAQPTEWTLPKRSSKTLRRSSTMFS